MKRPYPLQTKYRGLINAVGPKGDVRERVPGLDCLPNRRHQCPGSARPGNQLRAFPRWGSQYPVVGMLNPFVGWTSSWGGRPLEILSTGCLESKCPMMRLAVARKAAPTEGKKKKKIYTQSR